MRTLSRALARALLVVGIVTLLVGVIVCGLGLYVGSWPLRRLGRRSEHAPLVAVQELAVAMVGAVSVFRQSKSSDSGAGSPRR